MIECVYPTKARLRTGVRVTRLTDLSRLVIDRSTDGIEVDLEVGGMTLVLDDASAAELALALLLKVSPKELAKVNYQPDANPALRLQNIATRFSGPKG